MFAYISEWNKFFTAWSGNNDHLTLFLTFVSCIDTKEKDIKIELKEYKSFQKKKKKLKNMQNKVTVHKQEVTHTELKYPRSQWKQKRPKTNERNVVSSEQQARHMELKSPRFSLFPYRKWLFREKRKGVVSHFAIH